MSYCNIIWLLLVEISWVLNISGDFLTSWYASLTKQHDFDAYGAASFNRHHYLKENVVVYVLRMIIAVVHHGQWSWKFPPDDTQITMCRGGSSRQEMLNFNAADYNRNRLTIDNIASTTGAFHTNTAHVVPKPYGKRTCVPSLPVTLVSSQGRGGQMQPMLLSSA